MQISLRHLTVVSSSVSGSFKEAKSSESYSLKAIFCNNSVLGFETNGKHIETNNIKMHQTISQFLRILRRAQTWLGLSCRAFGWDKQSPYQARVLLLELANVNNEIKIIQVRKDQKETLYFLALRLWLLHENVAPQLLQKQRGTKT